MATTDLCRQLLIKDIMAFKFCLRGLIFTLIFHINIVLCNSSQTCTLRNNSDSKKQILHRMSPLQGKKFEVEHGGAKYAIAICTNASYYANASVIKTTGASSEILALYNDTDVASGDSWISLMYGNETKIPRTNVSLCNVTRVQVMITCNEETDSHPLHYVDEWKDSGVCFYMFELHSTALCPKEGLSNGSVFCIIFLTSVGLYLMIGIAYRRLVGGAQGIEQIPNYEFWKDLGNLQADGCNFICRRDMQREESWRRLTNNFNDPHDDAMLRP